VSILNPRGILGVVGVCLFLIALYLVLEKGGNATTILGAVTSGAIGIASTLQGRNVSYTAASGSAVSNSGSISVSGTP